MACGLVRKALQVRDNPPAASPTVPTRRGHTYLATCVAPQAKPHIGVLHVLGAAVQVGQLPRPRQPRRGRHVIRPHREPGGDRGNPLGEGFDLLGLCNATWGVARVCFQLCSTAGWLLGHIERATLVHFTGGGLNVPVPLL